MKFIKLNDKTIINLEFLTAISLRNVELLYFDVNYRFSSGAISSAAESFDNEKEAHARFEEIQKLLGVE